MKTTIDLPDELLHRAKVLAAERRTTLKELVIEGLEKVTGAERERAAARARQLFAVMDSVGHYSASTRMTRDQAHERR